MSKLMKIATTEMVRVTKPQTREIRKNGAGQNIGRMREAIERRWRSSLTVQIHPDRRENLLDDSRRVKIVDSDETTSAATQIERKILREEGTHSEMGKQRQKPRRHQKTTDQPCQ